MIKSQDIIIRMALNADAEALSILTASVLPHCEIQWQDATNDWMVAEVDGKVHGCIQLCMGRPIGRLEMLCVKSNLDPRTKHVIMMELGRGGIYALKQMGSQLVTAFVEFDNKGFKRIFKKRFDARVTNSGNLLTMYLGV